MCISTFSYFTVVWNVEMKHKSQKYCMYFLLFVSHNYIEMKHKIQGCCIYIRIFILHNYIVVENKNQECCVKISAFSCFTVTLKWNTRTKSIVKLLLSTFLSFRFSQLYCNERQKSRALCVLLHFLFQNYIEMKHKNQEDFVSQLHWN